jgi:hypothetical protein
MLCYSDRVSLFVLLLLVIIYLQVEAGKVKEHLLCAVDEYFVGYALDKSEV